MATKLRGGEGGGGGLVQDACIVAMVTMKVSYPGPGRSRPQSSVGRWKGGLGPEQKRSQQPGKERPILAQIFMHWASSRCNKIATKFEVIYKRQNGV